MNASRTGPTSSAGSAARAEQRRRRRRRRREGDAKETRRRRPKETPQETRRRREGDAKETRRRREGDAKEPKQTLRLVGNGAPGGYVSFCQLDVEAQAANVFGRCPIWSARNSERAPLQSATPPTRHLCSAVRTCFAGPEARDRVGCARQSRLVKSSGMVLLSRWRTRNPALDLTPPCMKSGRLRLARWSAATRLQTSEATRRGYEMASSRRAVRPVQALVRTNSNRSMVWPRIELRTRVVTAWLCRHPRHDHGNGGADNGPGGQRATGWR